MIKILNNECPICLTTNLCWNLNYKKSDMEMFKCGHGTCKECYKKLNNDQFRCPICRETGQQHFTNKFTFQSIRIEKGIIVKSWNTIAEWYDDYEIYIKTENGKNIIKNSVFGKQLIRLIKVQAKVKNLTNKKV